MEIEESMNTLAQRCYEANLTGGWHHDLNTNEYIDFDKSFWEKISLVHSECSEAVEHFRKGGVTRPDDKLVDESGVRTEICDAIIRLAGMLGQMDNDYQENGRSGYVLSKKMQFNANRADHKVENRRKDGGKKS